MARDRSAEQSALPGRIRHSGKTVWARVHEANHSVRYYLIKFGMPTGRLPGFVVRRQSGYVKSRQEQDLLQLPANVRQG